VFDFLFPGREYFLVVIILPDKLSCVFLALNKDKTIIPKKTRESKDWAELVKHFRLDRFKGPVIFAADSSMASTVLVPIDVIRDNPALPLGDVELENLLSQAVGRVFNQCREQAAVELQVDDLEMVLAGSKVTNFKVDDHRVISPLGFQAKRIGAVFEITFALRSVLENIKQFLGERRDFFFRELGRAELLALQKIQKPPIGFLDLKTTGRSFSFLMDRAAIGHVIYRREFKWNPYSFRNKIAEYFEVSKDAAYKLYEAYIQGQTSETVRRFLNRIGKPAIQEFLAAVKQAKLKGQVYINSPVTLPFSLPYRAHKIIFNEPPLNFLLEQLGFRIEPVEWPMPPFQILRHLAPFFDYYYNRSDSTINRWLKRRLSWLGSIG
jgi:hypothetical protein